MLLTLALAASPPPLPPPLDRVDEGPTVWRARYLDAHERALAAPWFYPLGLPLGVLGGGAAYSVAAAGPCSDGCIDPGGAVVALPIGAILTTVAWTAMTAGIHHRAAVDRREAAWHLCRDGGLAAGPLPRLDEATCQRDYATFPESVPDARNPGDWPLPAAP